MTTIYLFIIIIIVILVIFWQISTLISVYGGVQYVGSDLEIIDASLKISKLNGNKTYCEIGSGLGSGLLVSAKKYGAKSIGVEISPFHFIVSRFKTLGNSKIKVINADAKKINYSKADVVYLYLSPRLLKDLLSKFQKELKKGAIVISHSFELPGYKYYEKHKILNKKVYFYRF